MTQGDETDFMNELQAAEKMKPREGSKILLFTIGFLILYLIIWASLSEIEELTRGQGQVVPSSEIQVVQSLEGGIVEEILVREGDKVEQGQTLLRLSDVMFSSEERGTKAKFLSLQAKAARLRAEADEQAFIVPDNVREKVPKIAANEIRLYTSRQEQHANKRGILADKIKATRARLSEAEAEIARYNSSYNSLKEELAITSEMVRKKAMPKIEKIRLERQMNEANGKAREARQRAEGLRAELHATKKELEEHQDKRRSQALEELNAVETEITGLQENLRSMKDQVARREVRAPVTGIVDKLSVQTIGGVVEPAKPIVEIVPLGEDLKIVAKVSPNNIAFLTPGQEVNVKITAYDPQRYGSLNGQLFRVSANSVEDRDGNIFFEVEVRTEKNYLGSEDNPLPITTGMVASVEIITGYRTIMEYLMKPILRARSVALTER